MKNSLVVHQYFKKSWEEGTLIVMVNPINFTGEELFVPVSGKPQLRKMRFDEDIFEDLKVDQFTESSPLEFQLIKKGLA